MLRRGVGTALLAALVVGALGGLAWLGTWPPMTTVESDSMRPTLDTGDLLLLREVGEVEVGDVVVVPVPAPLQAERGYPARLAHRVVAVEDGRVTTQGDQHEHPDPFTVPVEAVGQRAVAAVPFAGYALAFLRSPVGMIWLLGGLVLLAVRQRRPDDESAPATAADLQALRADLAELLSAPQGQTADADAGAVAALAEEAPAAQDGLPAPADRAEPAPSETEPEEAPAAADEGWPAPLRPSAGRRAALRASKAGTVTRRSLAELARTRQTASDEDDETSERSA